MRKIFALALLAAGTLMASEAIAQPCPDLPPIGTVYTCYFVNGGKVVVGPGGPVPSNSTGSATVYVVAHRTPPIYPVCEAILSPNQFSSTGEGRLGVVSTALAPGSPDSRLTGNATSLFPADLELNLNLKATVSSLGGTFVSQNPLKLRASGIRGLPLRAVSVRQIDADFVKLTNEKGQSIGLQEVGVVLNP